MSSGDVLWEPPADVREISVVGRFLAWLEQERGLSFDGYADLHAWSVRDLDAFWTAVWGFFGVESHAPYRAVREGTEMPDVRWFPGARLNYAEHALRRRGTDVAITAHSEGRPPVSLSWDGLRDEVARIRAGLEVCGVGPGDVVAGYLPNTPEAVIAHLAAASLGAAWACCSPELGVRSVLDRLGQVQPKVLFAVSEYRYGGRDIDRSTDLAAIRDGLADCERVIVVSPRDDETDMPDAVAWHAFGAGAPSASRLNFTPVDFEHPLVVLFSSGTTGLPKAIVHGHGGILLEHYKSLGLQFDIDESDGFFWHSSTTWMVWNVVVSGLLVGARIHLFDGSPTHPDLSTLWRFAADTGATFVGLSAAFIERCRTTGVNLSGYDLSRVRGVGSTGSPLSVDGYAWVYETLGDQVVLMSSSGGTDVASSFVGGCPLVPVYAGEISCPALGCDVAAFGPDGRPVVGREGELVVFTPMPSMPVAFWSDEDRSRLTEEYFSYFPGVWRHGDWITFTERGSCVISGRSDATLNRGGVRLGTGEIYACIEGNDGVTDSLVVHVDAPREGGALVLLIALQDGLVLDDDRRRLISERLRHDLSPRHVPDLIHEVPEIPRTLTGKKLEVPVKRILEGADVHDVASEDAVAGGEVLREIQAMTATLPGLSGRASRSTRT